MQYSKDNFHDYNMNHLLLYQHIFLKYKYHLNNLNLSYIYLLGN